MKKRLAWGAGFTIFLLPLGIMLIISGACAQVVMCQAGLYFTLLLYGIGFFVFVIALVLARLIFKARQTPTPARIRVIKKILLILLTPGAIILVLLIYGLLHNS